MGSLVLEKKYIVIIIIVIIMLVYLDTLRGLDIFLPFLPRKMTFVVSCLLYCMPSPFLLWEQICFFLD